MKKGEIGSIEKKVYYIMDGGAKQDFECFYTHRIAHEDFHNFPTSGELASGVGQQRQHGLKFTIESHPWLGDTFTTMPEVVCHAERSAGVGSGVGVTFRRFGHTPATFGNAMLLALGSSLSGECRRANSQHRQGGSNSREASEGVE